MEFPALGGPLFDPAHHGPVRPDAGLCGAPGEVAVGQAPAQTLVYGAQYFLFTTILSFPLTAYEGFFREQKYGLSNQTFGAWLGEQGIGIAVGAVLGGVAIMILYAILRRSQAGLVDLGVGGVGRAVVRGLGAGAGLYRAAVQRRTTRSTTRRSGTRS